MTEKKKADLGRREGGKYMSRLTSHLVQHIF